MFQFPGFALKTLCIQVISTWFSPLMIATKATTTNCQVGCPIRKSLDQSLFSAPQSLSQSITSFIASYCQGIHQTPFSRLIRSRRRKLASQRSAHPFVRCRPFFRPKGMYFSRRHHMDDDFWLVYLTWTTLSLAILADPCHILTRKWPTTLIISLNDVKRFPRNHVRQDETEPKGAVRSCRLSVCIGGAYRNRTDDLLLAKQALSQLS